MRVSEAVATRQSVRGFLDTPVPFAVLKRVLEAAARAPSGGNLQPWHIYVVSGEPLDTFKGIMKKRVAEAPAGEPTEYDIYPRELISPYRDRRFKGGEDLYAQLGIPRTDKTARLGWFSVNYQFFGAPVGLFCYVDRGMGPPQWSDLGMYLQTIMLLLREEGLDSCAQECWAIYHKTVAAFLNPPADHMLFCGMSVGYKHPDEPANRLRTERAPLDEHAKFIGF